MPKRRRQREYEPKGRYAEPIHPEWLDGPVPKGFWNDPANRKRYLIWLGKKLGFKKWEDWYRITLRDFYDNHGSGVVSNQYNKSPIRAVASNFPEYEWKEWLFGQASNGFWDDPQNRRRYMTWLAGMLGVSQPEDWYKVSQRDYHRYHGDWDDLISCWYGTENVPGCGEIAVDLCCAEDPGPPLGHYLVSGLKINGYGFGGDCQLYDLNCRPFVGTADFDDDCPDGCNDPSGELTFVEATFTE